MRQMPRSALRHTLTALVAVLACSATAGPASASVLYTPDGDECNLVRSPLFAPYGQALTDLDGFTISMGPGSNGGYATLWDGGTGSLPADTWNGWGQLYVGATPSNGNAYVDADAHGCARSASGQQVDFAQTTIGALHVRRSMLVPSSGASGVRIVDAVTNPTASPVTTSIWVGDLLKNHSDGLGSDGGTTIRTTSSGDAAMTPSDLWAVTTDQRTVASDPALAHVWGGPGSATPITLVRSGAQAGDKPIDDANGTLDTKQLGWGWQNVTIAPGATARFLSWEIASQAGARSWVDQAPLAQTAAEDLLAAPLATRYLGMTASEIATVRNWAPPAVDGGIASVPGATTAADTTLHAVGIDFGDGDLAACTDGTLHWDLGDGAHATGDTIQHRFAAGTAHVMLTIAGECGGRATRTLNFSVVAPPVPTPVATPDPTPTPLPTPAPTPGLPATDDRGDAVRETVTPPAGPTGPTLKLFGPPSVKTTTLASAHGLVVGVQASVDGEVRMVLTGTGVKSVKSAQLKAGVTSLVKVQLDPSARPAALTLKTIRLRAKLLPSGGGEVVENLILKLRR